MFFALEPKKAVINDFNDQLINLYNQVKLNPEELKNKLDILTQEHDGTAEHYYIKRGQYNECLKKNEHSADSAALFVYLNKAGFNGMYRVNSKNEFNVPFSKRKTVNLYDSENIDSVSKVLRNTDIFCGDFEQACKNAPEKSFFFIDPPYYSTFTQYTANDFGPDDQIRLRNVVDELTKRNCYCIITNSNEEFIKDIYKNYKIQVVDVKRMINSDASNRKGQEVIITNY